MKSTIKAVVTFATIVICLASCNRTQPETISVSLDKTSVSITYGISGEVTYTAANFTGDVVPALRESISDVTISNKFDKATGKGIITFSTAQSKDAKYETAIVFKDDNGTFTTDKFTVVVYDVWTIEPDDPEVATE